ncbi:MAG: hypothetical protein ACI4EK_02895 [Wujia sp.]
MKWYWAVLSASFICIGLVAAVRQDELEYMPFSARDMWKLVVAALIIIGWVYFSGVGGFSYQNQDHGIRTSIYRALVEYDWPVVSADGSRGLIYYIGYWLPAAVIGKMFGFRAGYTFQAIWAVAGIFFVYYLLCVWRKKISLWPLLVLILFSGLDYIGAVLLQTYGDALTPIKHIEWWSKGLQFSSNTTQLYWVFNQAVPAWVVTIYLVVTPNKRRGILFLVGCLLLHSAFPFVGILPIVVYYMFRDFKFRKEDFYEIFSISNIVGVVIIGGISFLYFIGNTSGGNIAGSVSNSTSVSMGDMITKYALFYFLEFGIYAIILFAQQRKNPLYYLLIGILFVCPWIKIGSNMDFCMRASIPALFVLMLMCIAALDAWFEKKKWIGIVVLCIVLMIGAITPVHEIHRSIYRTNLAKETGKTAQREEVEVEDMLTQPNFYGDKQQSVFFRYLAR